MRSCDRPGGTVGRVDGADCRLVRAVDPVAPSPGIAEPERRQKVQFGGLGAAVRGDDADMNLVRRGLGVGDLDVEITVLAKRPGIDEIEGRVVPRASRVLLQELAIGKSAVRILVEIAHEAVGWRGVEVEVVFLHVLAAVALRSGQSEGALLQDGIAAVPQSQRETQALLIVADAAETVLAPAIGPRARLIVGEVIPGLAVGAVVFAHGSPRPLGEIGSPQPPVLFSQTLVLQAGPFETVSVSASHCRTPCDSMSLWATRSAQA